MNVSWWCNHIDVLLRISDGSVDADAGTGHHRYAHTVGLFQDVDCTNDNLSGNHCDETKGAFNLEENTTIISHGVIHTGAASGPATIMVRKNPDGRA